MNENFCRNLFKAYYESHAQDIPKINTLDQREFAFLYWNRGGMVRHLKYPGHEFLLKELASTAPRHCYHSAAYYELPAADSMDKKKFKGCDFIVDIDADHIPTPCFQDHNYTICKNCGEKIEAEKPEKCENCGGTKFDKIVWICQKCLDITKEQVYHFIDNFLVDDFGISMDKVQLFFSGHRGYHVHVEEPIFHDLDQEARREIVDYITGQGFSFKIWNFQQEQNNMQGFRIDQPGWAGKIARELYSILKNGESQITNIFGSILNKTLLTQLVDNRQDLLTRIERKMSTWQVKSIGQGTWYKIFEVLRDRIKSDIDAVVSIDLHRLIRLAGSLHGKTGFVVKEVKYEHLPAFNPLSDACAFPHNSGNKLELKMTVPFVPAIELGGNIYGPFNRDEIAVLPLNAGLFLLCKDVAQLISIIRN